MDNQDEVSPQPIVSLSEHKPKPFLSKSTIILIIVIFIVFAILYVGIYSALNKRIDQITKTQTTTPSPAVSPTPTVNTTNWKTYNSKGNSFAFKYPSNWEYNERNDDIEIFSNKRNNVATVEFNKILPKLTPGQSYNIFAGDGTILFSFYYMTNPDFNNLSLEEFIDKLSAESYSSATIASTKDLTIGILQVKEIHLTCDRTAGCARVVFKRNDTFYFANDENYNNLDQIYQILSTFKFLDDKEITVKGMILENNLGCRVDVSCYLRLRVNDDEIKVVYHRGDSATCPNEKAADQGFQIKVGDRVEAFGKHAELGNRRIISTCDSETYYIQKLQ